MPRTGSLLPATPEPGVLVVRNDRLGDAILALPTINPLREYHPDHKLYFWASPHIAPLLEHVVGVDGVISDSGKGYRGFKQFLQQSNIQIAYCLRPTLHNASWLARAGVPERIGTARRAYSILFTKRINLPRRGVLRHEADLNLDLIASAGVPTRVEFPQFDLPIEAISRVEELLNGKILPETKLVVLHPGSGGSARDWHVSNFRKLADRLGAISGVRVAVTGTASEAAICREVACDRHLDLCSRLNLLELAALLKRAALLVTNSTGPLHLAVALGSRVLGLYSPVADCLPERWGPYGHPEWALKPDLPLCPRCSPGEYSACRCMEQLTPDYVIEKAQEALWGV